MTSHLDGSGGIKFCSLDLSHEVVRKVSISKVCDGVGHVVSADNADLLGVPVLLNIPGITVQLSRAGVVEMLLKGDKFVVIPARLSELVT